MPRFVIKQNVIFFQDKGELSNHKPRDVVRCIRPVLEGFIRLKYYLHIDEGEWLGDFIKKIRDSKEGDAFYPQQKNIVDIEDLNDYSKTYHHANPNCIEEPIVSSELQGYCKMLFKVIEKIQCKSFLSLDIFRQLRGANGGQNERKSANIEVKNQKTAKMDEILNV